MNGLLAADPALGARLWDAVLGFLNDGDMWFDVLIAAVKIIAIWFGGRLLIKAINRTILRVMEHRAKSPEKIDVRRNQTLGKLANNVLTYSLQFIVLLLILGQLGFNLLPLLAGAGVIGLAIGFGAQNLVKDVITGFFILLEDQFAVGDVIQTGNFRGTVEEIGLRVTKIRNWTGEVHILPNGSITDVTNFSLNNSVGFIDVSIAYEADIDQAMRVIKETAASVYKTNDNMVKEPEVLGVQALGQSEVVIRVTAECKPQTQFGVCRILNAEIKKALDTAGIEIPYPRIVALNRTEGA